MDKSEKKLLRKEILKRLDQLSGEERRTRSARITEKVIASAEFKAAKTCLFFVSKSYEVDTSELIKETIRQDKRAAVPAFDKAKPELVASEIVDLECDLEKGSFGILVPRSECIRQVKEEEIDLVFVPGLAFDESNHRLGHGGGYYDRFLSKNTHFKTIGLAFNFQILPKLPVSPHDVPVNKVITD